MTARKGVMVRFDDADHARLRVAAASAGGSMDGFVRALVLRYLDRNVPVEGHMQVPLPAVAPPATKVVDLMGALEASVDAAKVAREVTPNLKGVKP